VAPLVRISSLLEVVAAFSWGLLLHSSGYSAKGTLAAGAKTDTFGLGALAMFKSPAFTVFILCAFMVSIFGSNYFFPSVVAYLSESVIRTVALTTLNQFSELFFMAILPFCVARFGLKWVLVIGMSAWAIRYFIFPLQGFQFALIGLLFHGMAYAFLYAAAYMFGDRVAPAHLKASVQSLLAFLLLGIGQVLSGYLFGYQIDRCAPAITKTVVTQEGKSQRVFRPGMFLKWKPQAGDISIWQNRLIP